jgi:acetyl esterase/lipase
MALDDKEISDHVTVRVYRPPGQQITTHARPVTVFYHGGGWVMGDLDTEDYLCRTMCGGADIVVVSVLYRKFPAIKFPDNIQDCYDGFQWVRGSCWWPRLTVSTSERFC